MERAMAAHDAGYDGVFYVAVRTTGVFCRPSCRPPRSPKPANVEFFGTVKECVVAGYRPCKLCRPAEANGTPPPDIGDLMQRVETQPDARFTAGELRALGLTPERVRRWFNEHHGMTFAAWCRARRLSEAFNRIRRGDDLDDVTLAHGYESHSGFREAFGRTFGKSPGRIRPGEEVLPPLWTTFLDTPIGRMLAAAGDDGVALLEFNDRTMLPTNYATLRKRFGCAVVPGKHAHLEHLRDELGRYFAGQVRGFKTPLSPRGTPFQERVWNELRRIPHATTISYDELAQRIGQPTAQRAVARANAQNRIAILIPCHRVIGKDGTLTGYGGGLWRKRLLLELERTGGLPD
jgi:AraC family transcriptional regulator of adaptative response/methylated-DNA-[protein]-cysteine methyltransferase